MPSVAERIKDFLSKERAEREKRERELRELEMQEIGAASRRAEELGRLIKSLRTQEILEGINEELLRNKGVIKSHTGLFSVRYERTTGGWDANTEVYFKREPLSFVSLTWSTNLWQNHRSLAYFKLFVAAAPQGELCAGCWQQGNPGEGYIPQRVINPYDGFLSDGLPRWINKIILSKIDPSITGEEIIDLLRERLKDNITEALLNIHKRTGMLDKKLGPTWPHQVQ